MRTDQLSFEAQPVFERVVTGLIGIGAIVGVLMIPISSIVSIASPVTLGVVLATALLGASSLRGNDETLSVNMRGVGVVAAALVGFCFQSVTAMVLTLGAITGLAMSGRAVPVSRQATGIVAGLVGTLWAMWAVPGLVRMLPGLPVPMRSVVEAAAGSVFIGGALLLLHVKVHADAMSARLRKVGGAAGVRLQRTWDRCHQSLRTAPAAEKREVLTLLEANAREAERLASQLVTLEARLVAADRKDAETQVAALKADVASATDATTRARLSSAVLSLSDSLEALDAMERKRERLHAELKLNLATLERAALALETAQGEPAELKSLVLRLSQPAATA